MHLISTEQVSKYHPDKVADQISDAIVTECLRKDPRSHVAVECLIKSNLVVLAGELTTKAEIDYEEVALRVLRLLHYNDPYTFVINITKQSAEINKAVNIYGDLDIGAGDQGIMYGFATRETQSRLPWPFDMANKIIKAIEEDIGAKGSDCILKGDAKTQVTADLDSEQRIAETIIVSACHVPEVEDSYLYNYIAELLKSAGVKYKELVVNPGGRWTVGGPSADCGVTGRKIVCDQYGGLTAVGGGAFSGKDPTKVDRSASYMARHLAMRVIDKFNEVNWCEIQLAYGIGMTQPVSVAIRTNLADQTEVEEFVMSHNLTPKGIIEALDLLKVDYEALAQGCHYRYDWTKAHSR